MPWSSWRAAWVRCSNAFASKLSAARAFAKPCNPAGRKHDALALLRTAALSAAAALGVLELGVEQLSGARHLLVSDSHWFSPEQFDCHSAQDAIGPLSM